MTPSYENVVSAAQAAVAAEARHTAALAATEGEAHAIRHRILDFDGQRSAIIVRRLEGEERDTLEAEHGRRLSLGALSRVLAERGASTKAA